MSFSQLYANKIIYGWMREKDAWRKSRGKCEQASTFIWLFGKSSEWTTDNKNNCGEEKERNSYCLLFDLNISIIFIKIKHPLFKFPWNFPFQLGKPSYFPQNFYSNPHKFPHILELSTQLYFSQTQEALDNLLNLSPQTWDSPQSLVYPQRFATSLYFLE